MTEVLKSPLFWSIICGTVGIWLMLPKGGRRRRMAGGAVAVVGLGLLAVLLPPLGPIVQRILFWSLGGATVIAAVMTISSRSPVYSAIWFAFALLTTAGLFLLQGAQFLSVATIVVYAGAILVTFLFVLMLAQPQGHDVYDRISWGRLAPLFAAITGLLLVGGLTYVVRLDQDTVAQLETVTVPEEADNAVLAENHMAELGSQLFTRHLVSVEVAGILLLVALIGAIAIVAHKRQQGEREGVAAEGGSVDA